MSRVNAREISTYSPSLSTAEFALQLKMQSQTLRKHHALNGAYYGVRPFKMPNGKLRWPADALEQLMKGGAA